MNTRAKILSLASDHHAAEIARLVGLSRQRVSQVLRKSGMKAAVLRSNEALVRERRKTLERMSRDGCTLSQVATALGLTKQGVCMWRQRHGLSHLKFKRSDQVIPDCRDP